MWVEYLPRFRRAIKQLETLADREQWSRSEIEAFQLARINDLWASASRSVPHYVKLATDARLPSRFDSLAEFRERVPLLDKHLVRTNPEHFLSAERETGKWARTGGSTGIPMRVYWGTSGHREMLRCKYRGEQAWGLSIFDRKSLLWGHSNATAPGWRGRFDKLIEPYVDRVRCRNRMSAYRLGEDDLKRHLEAMARFEPKSIYGYSTAVMLLAKQAAKENARFPSLKVAIMTGEPAYPTMIDECERGFACPAAVEYGSMECGLIAYRYPDGTFRVREDVNLVESVPRPDGRFNIVVTVLNNPSFPLIRYVIEDVCTAPLVLPPTGFAILSDVAGRNNDMLVTRSGQIIHSMAIKHAIEYDPALRRYQVVQKADGGLDVVLETNVKQASEFSDIEAKLTEILEGYPVHIRVTEKITSSPSGKHRWIFSHLDPRSLSEFPSESTTCSTQ